MGIGCLLRPMFLLAQTNFKPSPADIVSVLHSFVLHTDMYRQGRRPMVSCCIFQKLHISLLNLIQQMLQIHQRLLQRRVVSFSTWMASVSTSIFRIGQLPQLQFERISTSNSVCMCSKEFLPFCCGASKSLHMLPFAI